MRNHEARSWRLFPGRIPLRPYNLRLAVIGRSILRPLSVLLAGCLFWWTLTPATRGEEPTGLQLAVSIEQTMIDVIAKCERSVVSIARVNPERLASMPEMREDFGPFGPPQFIDPENPRPESPSYVPQEFATGVVIDRTGLILTNFHVLVDKSEYWIRTVDHKTYQVKVYAADERSDLAVLKVVKAEEGTAFTPIKLGDASKLKKGQIVIALGNPYAIARDGQASASWGIVSNLSRKLGLPASADRIEKAEKVTLHNFGTLIQTDAKLNFGTSGGALVNLQGEMVGLTTSLAATSGYEQAAGYAIPVDPEFLRIIETLKQGKEVEYGFLGVQPFDLQGSEIRAGLQGIRIGKVSTNTPALREGLLEQDLVTHIDGTPIYDADGLRLRIGILPPADKVSLTVNRLGQTVVKQVTLSKMGPPYDSGKKVFTVKSPEWRGMRVDYCRALQQTEFTHAYNDNTVAVRDVADGSPAARAGIRVQRLISHVGTTPVRTPEEFRREVASRTGKVTLRLIGGAGEPQSVTIDPE